MQNIYTDTRVLDRQALAVFGLTEDILMENAAAALERELICAVKFCKTDTRDFVFDGELRVLIVTGAGDNGGDGWALARRLQGCRLAGCSCFVTVVQAFPPKSEACKRQAARAKAVQVYTITEVPDEKSRHFHVVVDCLFGSGFHGPLSGKAFRLIEAMNGQKAFRIACDVPSGIDSFGCGTFAFRAHISVCMGALKTSLFSDFAKNYTGKIVKASLGVSSELFQTETVVPAAFLLEACDMLLPERKIPAVHKGDFGHAAVYTGEKAGAGIIAACAAFRCGAGLVSLVHPEGQSLRGSCGETYLQAGMPFYLMQSDVLPKKTACIAAGMGFGCKKTKRTLALFSFLAAHSALPCLLDADMFYYAQIKELLEKRPVGLVLTPHPKEFQSLLSLCGIGRFSVEAIVRQRLELVNEFCMRYPGAVLVLKGANMLIGCSPVGQKTEDVSSAKNSLLYVNAFAGASLAKAGSGDVLAGFICAFLAQKYAPLEAAIQGTLVLAATSRLQKASYASTPFTLIQGLENPEKLYKVLKDV